MKWSALGHQNLPHSIAGLSFKLSGLLNLHHCSQPSGANQLLQAETSGPLVSSHLTLVWHNSSVNQADHYVRAVRAHRRTSCVFPKFLSNPASLESMPCLISAMPRKQEAPRILPMLTTSPWHHWPYKCSEGTRSLTILTRKLELKTLWCMQEPEFDV